MGPYLVLVEHEAQVGDVLQRSWKGRLTWAAMGPGAMFELQRRQIPFVVPEDYYESEDLASLEKEFRGRLENACNIIDELLRQNIGQIEKLGITPTLFYYHALSVVVDVLTARVFQIKRLLAEIKPQVIVAHTSPGYPPTIYGVCFDNRESLYGRLLSLKGWDVEVSLLPQVILPQDGAGQREPAGIRVRIGGAIATSNLLYNAVRNWRCFGWRGLKQLNQKGASTVCIQGYYEWPHILDDLVRAGVRVMFLPREFSWSRKNIVGEEKREYLVTELERNPLFRELFVCQGIDIYPLVKERVAYLVGDNVNRVISAYQGASRLFQRQNVSALLTSSKSLATDHAVSLAAQRSGISTLNWHHGSAGYYDYQTIEFQDFLTTDIYLTYGEGVCRYLESKIEKYPAVLKPVGSVSLDKIRNMPKTNALSHDLSQQLSWMRKEGRKICLYATSNYFQNALDASHDPPPSDNIIYRTQLTLISELAKHPRLCLILKLHPSTNFRTPPWLNQFSRESPLIVIHQEYSYSELLYYSDLVVLEWPTTTLLQAMAANKPIFTVMKHLKVFPEARQALQRRAVCADEPEDLLDALKKYLESGVYPADVGDNAFLKAYGTHLDDGHSSERAAETVLKAMESRRHIGD